MYSLDVSLQPHSEFVASFWICDLILIKNMLSFQREIGLSYVLDLPSLYIIWYTYCLVVCLVKQYQTNQHINNIFIEHVQAKTLSLNTPDIISQFHQIGSNVLQMITFVTEWYIYANLIQKTSICICLFEENPPDIPFFSDIVGNQRFCDNFEFLLFLAPD